MIGIGTSQGAPIPVPGTNNYIKDRSGQVVVTKFNEQMAKDIAQAGNGAYIHCDNTNTAMRALQQEIDKLATADIETTVYTDYNEQYQSFALLALLILVIDCFIFNRQHKLFDYEKLFK